MAAPRITWRFVKGVTQAGWQEDSVGAPSLQIIHQLLDISSGSNLSQTVQAEMLASGPPSLTVSTCNLIENCCSFIVRLKLFQKVIVWVSEVY